MARTGATSQRQAKLRFHVLHAIHMVSRRQFMRGDFKARQKIQRPPWALPEEAFLDACTRCDECIAACPTDILVKVRGYPEVDFKRGECTFCGDCAATCKPGALQLAGSNGMPWQIKAVIAETCLPVRGVECRICGDHCEEDAIRFSPRLGGPPVAEITSDSCTGCGACVARCPVTAISLA